MSHSNDISIQIAEVEDAEMLTETCRRAFNSDSEFGAPGTGGPPGFDSIEWNTKIIQNKYLQYRKILFGSKIVGGFIVGNRGPGYQVCERIWVDPDYMRKGIATKAFELVWEKYPSADLWVLGTPEWNVRTNPFYKSLGFVQVGFTYDNPTWNGIYYEKRMSEKFPQAMSKISDIHNGRKRVLVEGKVDDFSSPRTVISRMTGGELKVAEVKLSDDSGSIKLVLWNEQIRQVKENTSIRIEEGYAKEYRAELQLSVGKWGMIITLL